MEAILIGLALTAIVVPLVLLAFLVTGIHREEHEASLTCQAPGLSAALARRLLRLYTRMPASTERCDHQHCETTLTPDRKA